MTNTDNAWVYFGEDDPYHAVLTKDEFQKALFDDNARRAFFQSGEDYVGQTFSTIQAQLDPHFAPRRALDFGCGVGRLVLPLARRAQQVVGVDVSPSMLVEAAANSQRGGLSNVEFVLSDDELSCVSGGFDFVHSFIVFQHIRPARGEAIIRQLLSRLDDGGIAVLHLTYADASWTPVFRRALTRSYQRVALATILRNALKRERLRRPVMQMNKYNLSRIFRLLQEAGCHDVHVRFTEASHFGHPVYGTVLYAKKIALDTRTFS